ncbi:hydroxyisourate hydrolase [Acinetobacter sp. WZC-1]|uniref:hydroxyisourate hydrolase n=1 Tax=Acinetobacter sp. WZC-1 TaxID=3459034 RepID=UPI00403E3154
MKKVAIMISGLGLSGVCFAQNPLSVDVISLETGQPSANVKVTLEAQQNNKWVEISTGTTNDSGQINALYPENKSLQKGIYKVTFKTGDWYKAKNQRSFFPEIPVVFVIDGSQEHYHIPLLVSPYGYSLYKAG